MTYLPNNLIQFAGFVVMLAAGTFGFIKGLNWYYELLKEKLRIKADADIKLALAQVELAKNNALTATQVADVLTKYNEVIDELEKMKTEDRYKDKMMLETINHLEEMVKDQIRTFQDFINLNFRK